MPRFFNTTGPCNVQDHYMLPPKDRLIGANLTHYIQNKLYWVLHAPRQSGKTTFLMSWMREINETNQGIACYVTVERCQQFPKAEDSIPAICEAIRTSAKFVLDKKYIPTMPGSSPSSALTDILVEWAERTAPKPLIVLFDEVDVLEDQAMVSFLRQLRGGFASRGIGTFPVSIVLVGLRDLRDYLIKSKDGVPINPGSPFNIKQHSASLSNFLCDDVHNLIKQHIDETGQVFETDALDTIFSLSKGQPWLVNAIAQKCTWDLCPNLETVTIDHVLKAKDMLIEERAVHLDSLAERLRDSRVKKIVEAIITGDARPDILRGDDFRLSLDLGLISVNDGEISIANPIYKEIISRVLTEEYQLMIPKPEFTWLKKNNTLDMDALFGEFQKFWARHSEMWELRADYTEAFPHLLLMAFFQRVINSGGIIEREYAAGRGRADLAIKWNNQWVIVEIKLIRIESEREFTIQEGLVQISKYRDTINPDAEAYLILFDRTLDTKKKSWKERLSKQLLKDSQDKDVTIIWC